MELYFAYPSTYSQKTLLALYEKGLDFTPKPVNLRDPAERESYRQLYPLGKIPLLIRDDGRLIPESTIIIEYLEDTFPTEPPLIPKDPEAARQVRFLDRMCDQYLNDPVVSLIFESMKPEASQNLELIEKSSELIGVLYGLLNQQLTGRKFLAGDTFTMADCAAIPALYYARSFAEFSIFEQIGAYWERIQEHPSWKRVRKEAGPHIKAILGETAQA
ncbi:MAG: glutathione S-transferase family protein [Ketobacteraceae bacterium]|nr:glutathione S-transferase family protein [Ketobacteraceae bacterium]